MRLALLFFTVLFFQDDVPFKPSDEFNVNVDVSFKEKTSGYAPLTYSANGDRLDKTSGAPKPFLVVKVMDFKIQPDELRIIAIDSHRKVLVRKKTSPNLALKFEMGFVDDLKAKSVANEITIFFLSDQKKELRKIVFKVADSGIFSVNGEWRGQF